MAVWHRWLPAGKLLIPGVIARDDGSASGARRRRIERFARRVGPERVMAGTDCGLGGRVHPQIAWAKLEALVAGAELAAKRLG
jgi:5-methyltetrahydropteroyltriglutamate--homocysteine methyltransferase